MTPHYEDPWLTVYHGDARAVMAAMEPESVHCVITSPPYWGLRDYGEPGQLGLEPTPEAYVESMVAVFREVRRVLRADGTVWLNLGDSYIARQQGWGLSDDRSWAAYRTGLAPKQLVGIPWRVAFALQADGWYLRSDIIWSKPNPMPESVTDRPTKSHEYLFLLSKSARYYFDADAVREAHSTEPQTYDGAPRTGRIAYGAKGNPSERAFSGDVSFLGMNPAGRNIRSVWTVATKPYPGAHFATFPPKLIEPCIKAGTSERGVCPECGAPWVRIVGEVSVQPDHGGFDRLAAKMRAGVGSGTTGWEPGCVCLPVALLIPATVLDPFAGSGTTGMVAQSLSRRAVLIDLSMDYLGQLMDRNRDIPLGLGA